MALISICARPAPNMGGPAVISIHAWTQTRALQTVLPELSIAEEKLRNILHSPKRKIMG